MCVILLRQQRRQLSAREEERRPEGREEGGLRSQLARGEKEAAGEAG